MVEFPPYVKLVVNNTMRKGTEPMQKSAASSKLREVKASQSTDGVDTSSRVQVNQDTVSLVSQENRRSWDTQPPTLQEAEEALLALDQDLPGLGQEVGDIHSHLDRRVILSLLAPLVM